MVIKLIKRFHSKCLKITEEQAKEIEEFVCNYCNQEQKLIVIKGNNKISKRGVINNVNVNDDNNINNSIIKKHKKETVKIEFIRETAKKGFLETIKNIIIIRKDEDNFDNNNNTLNYKTFSLDLEECLFNYDQSCGLKVNIY